MHHIEYYIILLTIIIGLTIILYIKKWGELLQMRQYAIYVTVPLLWSCVFVGLLLKTYLQIDLATNQRTILGITGISACYYWIGMLLFPSIEQFDSQSKFAYLDYYEHFRKQHQWIIGLALVAFLLPSFLIQGKTFLPPDYLLISSFGLAFFTEHKGLMCVIAWGVLSMLIFV